MPPSGASSENICGNRMARWAMSARAAKIGAHSARLRRSEICEQCVYSAAAWLIVVERRRGMREPRLMTELICVL